MHHGASRSPVLLHSLVTTSSPWRNKIPGFTTLPAMIHSVFTFSIPRLRNRLTPMLGLMCPIRGSTRYWQRL